MATLTVAVFAALEARGQGGVVMRRPGRATAALQFFREPSSQIDRALGERLVELLAALRRKPIGIVLRPWEDGAARHCRAMAVQILIQRAGQFYRSARAAGT